MNKIITLFLCLLFAGTLSAQTAPDFTVTDSDGVEHSLYADYLNQGKTVVLKIFFTSCPPCNAIAPWMQERYEQWGQGQYDVEFIELSTLQSDNDSKVNSYKAQHGITFPSVGADGGSVSTTVPYRQGTFGPYFGTPSLIVIAPDGTVNQGFANGDLNDAIAATGATGTDTDGGGGGPDPTQFDIFFSNSITPPPSTRLYLKPNGADTPKYLISQSGGVYSIDYPSDDFPEIDNPVIVAEFGNERLLEGINVVDLIVLRKLVDNLITVNDAGLIAADVDGDGNITVDDVVAVQQALLGLQTAFPNGTASFTTNPTEISLNSQPGQTIPLSFEIVKMGDVRN